MLDKIKEMVAENLGVDAATITEESGIEIPTEDLEQIATVGDVIKYINDHKE